MRRPLVPAALVALTLLASAAPSHAAPTEPDLPPVRRRVPRHPLSLLDGCTRADRALIMRRIEAAISVGAPAYNDGDFRGCYETYERTARQIEAALPSSCRGPANALRDGRQTARGRPDDAARAWAMRDAFDGLILVIDRFERRPSP